MNTLLSLFVLTQSSCSIDGELKECTYNLRLEYLYTIGGSSNRLTDYVRQIDGYVFDSEGFLQATFRTAGQDVLYGELSLTPGKYTVVSWGNTDTASRTFPDMQIGKTRLEEMQLRLDHTPLRSSSAGRFHPVAERLYYNCIDIEVPQWGVVRPRAYMTHSHCLLNLTVVWRQTPPENTDDFSFVLSDAPCRYMFLQSGYLSEASFAAPEGSIRYPLPGFLPQRTDIRSEAKMNIVRTLSGELLCYRLGNDDHPLLSIRQGDRELVGALDLWKFFTTMHIDLNSNLRQEFNLRIEIDGSKIFISTLSAGDWEDGGQVDGVF